MSRREKFGTVSRSSDHSPSLPGSDDNGSVQETAIGKFREKFVGKGVFEVSSIDECLGDITEVPLEILQASYRTGQRNALISYARRTGEEVGVADGRFTAPAKGQKLCSDAREIFSKSYRNAQTKIASLAKRGRAHDRIASTGQLGLFDGHDDEVLNA